MIRYSVVLSALAVGVLCLVSRPVSAQGTLPVIVPPYDKSTDRVTISNEKVTVVYSGRASNLLGTLMQEAKKPFVMTTAGDSGIYVRAQDVTLDEMLSMICEAASPPLKFTRRNGVYLFTVAPSTDRPAAPPQVSVSNNIPREDPLVAALASAGPNNIDMLLEMRLLSLQVKERQLAMDFVSDYPERRRNATEIKAIEQMIAVRRLQKARKSPQGKSAVIVRRKPLRTAQRP